MTMTAKITSMQSDKAQQRRPHGEPMNSDAPGSRPPSAAVPSAWVDSYSDLSMQPPIVKDLERRSNPRSAVVFVIPNENVGSRDSATQNRECKLVPVPRVT